MLYSITGEEANSLFTIDKFSGNLFVTQPLDREKKAAYRVSRFFLSLKSVKSTFSSWCISAFNC